jgi:hypothetical protein
MSTLIFKLKELYDTYEAAPRYRESTEKRWFQQLVLGHGKDILRALFTARGVAFSVNTIPVVEGQEKEWIEKIKELVRELDADLSTLDVPVGDHEWN